MKTAAKMKFGETMISIPMDGYDDDSVQTIRVFIDGIKGAMLDAGKHFSAEIVSTSNWHQYDTPAMMKVKDKMSDLISGQLSEYSCTFEVSDGTNLPFGVAARLTAKRKISEAKIIDTINPDGIAGAAANSVIAAAYYDCVECMQYIDFKDCLNIDIIPDLVSALFSW